MQLTLRDSGPADAPAILFLHASPLSGRMWLPQFERLTEFYCMAPDLPGHGGSAAIPLSMPDTVQRLADLIHQKAAGGRAHVVGLSFGGVVAQALMVAAPDSVDHVILSGTSTRLGKTLVALNGLNGFNRSTVMLQFAGRWPERLAATVPPSTAVSLVISTVWIESAKAMSSAVW